MAFATLDMNLNGKKIKVNLKARFTQKGSVIISTSKGDILEIQADGTVDLITTPLVQYTVPSKQV